MIRKFIAAGLCCALLATGASAQKRNSYARNGLMYTNAAGLRIEFGTGNTWVGPSLKHFFNDHSAGEVNLLFGTGVTVLGLEYQYHGRIADAGGLYWLLGLGPAVAFGKGGGTDLYFRPILGLDYKISNVPIEFGIDWRPLFRATHGEYGDRFTAARFSIPIRFTF